MAMRDETPAATGAHVNTSSLADGRICVGS